MSNEHAPVERHTIVGRLCQTPAKAEWRLTETPYNISVIRAIRVVLFCLLDEFRVACDFR